MTLLIVIGIVAIVMIFNFAKDSYEQSEKVTKEGGMRKKYAIIVDWVLASHSEAKIFYETSTSITAGVRGPSGTTTFDIVQTYGTVTIQYKVKNLLMGNHELEWTFPEYDNQRDMIRKIETDLEKYMNNVMSNFN